jgi:hypothetical protein
MTRAARVALQIGIGVVVGAACLLVSEQAILKQGDSLTATADARIGRPLTPLSYAGVARRSARRAAAVGAAAASSRCVQVVDAYGRVIDRCY